MINSSPITTWEGAGVFYSFADGGVLFWFWAAVVCCIIPAFVMLRAESAAEKEHS